MTKQQCPEPGELGRLAEGRLSGERRERLLEHIDQCRDCQEVLASVMSYRLQRREEIRTDKTTDRDGAPKAGKGRVLRPDRSRFRRTTLVLAAGVAAAVLLWFIIPFSSPLPRPSMLRARVSPLLDQSSPGDLARSFRPTDSTGGFAETLDARQRAFRVGVRLVDLSVAALLDSPVESERLEGAIRRLVPADWSEALAPLRPRPPKLGDLELVETRLRARERGLTAWMDLGIWAEAARLASAADLATYFDDRQVRDVPAHLSLGDVEPRIRDALAEALKWMPVNQPEDLDRLELALDELVALF